MNLVGHQKIREYLHSLLRQKNIPHSVLFYGVDGIGKKLVARELVLGMFCRESRPENLFASKEDHAEKRYCGSCPDCLNVLGGSHPDLLWISPSGPKSPAKKERHSDAVVRYPSHWTIKIEQVRDIKEKLSLFPFRADCQVVVFEDAEKMTHTAANSLLKTFEEPRANQVFILITSQLHRLLPTVRSRCARFYFSPLGEAEIREILAQHQDADARPDDETLQFFARCFQGSASYLLEAMQSGLTVDFVARLTMREKDFMAAHKLAGEAGRMPLDPDLLLQCLRQRHLEDSLAGSPIDPDFFERIGQAGLALSRHVQKDFVFENLFL